MADELSSMRATVIEKSINIEWLANAIISQHYFGRVKIAFVSEVLYDEYCSFALKRRVLLKICPELRGNFEKDLGRINTIRNYFAHCGQQIIEGPDPSGPTRIPDPKNFAKSIDFAGLYKEFCALEKPIVEQLFAVYKGKGGLADGPSVP